MHRKCGMFFLSTFAGATDHLFCTDVGHTKGHKEVIPCFPLVRHDYKAARRKKRCLLCPH